MRKIKKEINQKLSADFSKVNEQIHYENFTTQKRKISKKKVILATSLSLVGCASLCLVLIPVFSLFEVKGEIASIKKTYTIHEFQPIEQDTWQRLNHIQYPAFDSTQSKKQNYTVSEEYVQAMRQFASKIGNEMDFSKSNVIYSPMSLFATLDFISTLTNQSELKAVFDNLLSSSESLRSSCFDSAFRNNFYANQNGTVQMYQGFFSDYRRQINDAILPSLDQRYVEGYQLDFQKKKDVDRVLQWVDKHVNAKGFLNERDLEITDETAWIFFSTLYFNNKWNTKFIDENSKKEIFYGTQGEQEMTFMHHSYNCDSVYNYGSYLTFLDYYENSYTIKYFVPTKSGDNIFDLIQGQNIFVDDESKKMTPEIDENDPYQSKGYIVDLKLPKFEVSYFQDFSDILANQGLARAFEKDSHSFDYTYQNLSKDESIYLKYVKQKSEISMSETGTIVKSVTFAGANGATSAPSIVRDTIRIELNQPFLYIIQDSNGLPLYVGSFNHA